MKQFLLKPLIGLLSLLLACALTGCKDNEECASDADEGTKEVSFSLSYTGLSPTRTLTTESEKTIKYLDVFAFTVDPNGNEMFAYKTYATSIGENIAKARLLIDEVNQYRFVLVANMEEEIARLAFNPGESKAITLEKIEFAAYTLGDATIWDTDTPRYLPMWGELSAPTTVSEHTQTLGTIYMLRAVATVDVLLDADMSQWNQDDPELVSPLSGFKLKEVRVYNVPDIGCAVPDEGNIENIYASGMNATKPSMPNTFTRLETDFITYTPNNNNYIQKCIYIPEAFNNDYDANGSLTDMLPYNQRTCMVVQIENTNTGKASWYRMDFVKKKTSTTDADAVWDILRNHRYRFYITDIKGDGYNTPEEAYESTAVNLELGVINWNEVEDFDIIIEGGSYISFNNGKATIVADLETSTTRNYFTTNALEWSNNIPTNITMQLGTASAVTNVTTVENDRFKVELKIVDNETDSYYFLVTAKQAYNEGATDDHQVTLYLTFGRISFELPITQVPNNWGNGGEYDKEL